MNAHPRQTRRRRSTLGVAGIAALSLVVAACGGDDGPDTAPATDPPATTEAPAEMEGTQFGPACGAVPEDGAGSFAGMAQDPAATAASNNPLLSTLVSAVVEADLVDTLNSDGPFTIFAPVNDAFAAIPEDDLNAVLADTELLTSILTYHVIAGDNLQAADLGAAGSATTVNGGELTFGANGTTVNGVNVICSDVTVANATVHIIDQVLLPGAEPEAEEMSMGTQFGPACSAVPEDGAGSFDGMAQDPAATAASNNPLLSTLVAAVVEAGLVDTLNSDGPFTIFAPVNDAFAAIPEDDLNAVLADIDLLTSILTYHVIAGDNLQAADLAAAGSATTVNGGELMFGADGTTVNGVNVICSDVTVANATVHIIDQVLLPGAEMMGTQFGPACSAVPEDGAGSFAGMAQDPAATAASNNPLLSTLVDAVIAAELVDTLNSDGPFTIFAPVNDAFAAIPEDTLNTVLADVDLLTSILTYHVIAGENLQAADLAEIGSAATVNGGELTFGADGTTVNDVDVICSDVTVANATVHIIDQVLLPES